MEQDGNGTTEFIRDASVSVFAACFGHHCVAFLSLFAHLQTNLLEVCQILSM